MHKRSGMAVDGSRLRLAVITTVLALAACSGDAGQASESDESRTAPAESVTPGSTTEAQPAQEPRTLLTAIDSLPEEIRSALEPWAGDLPEMAQRRAVRLLTVYEPQFFGFDGHRQVGLIAEAGAALEEFLNERLDRHRLKVAVVILPVSRDLLIPFLEQGRGDIAAAGLTVTPERLERVDFADPFATGVSEIVVTGPGVEAPTLLEDLGSLELHVRPSSSFWESLQALDERVRSSGGQPLDLVAANELLATDDLLEMVSAGHIPGTVVDAYQAEFWSQIFPDLQLHPNLAVRVDGAVGWAIRQQSPVLKDALNDFIRTRRRGTLTGNILLRRYTQDTSRVQRLRKYEAARPLNPLRGAFQEYGEMYDLDWILLAAQAFQESRFEVNAKSDHGAVGIMQIKPASAQEVGIDDISTPEANIQAGAAYLRFLIDHYFDDPGLDPMHRQIMAIAGYNAGPTRVRRLRRRTADAGLDPNLWFDNVEVLVAREVGSETVRYVSNILKYYVTFTLSIEDQQLREAQGL